MTESNNPGKVGMTSGLIILFGILYIFAYQFNLPFKADVFLYCMLAMLLIDTFSKGSIIVNNHITLFLLIDLSAIIGLVYTTNNEAGFREAVLFVFFSGFFIMSYRNKQLIMNFAKWIYIASVVVVISSIVHYIIPGIFNDIMQSVLKSHAYEQLMHSFEVDHTFAGISAYTPNTTFSAAIVFGESFLSIINKNDNPIINKRGWNIVLLLLSLFSVIICSKRGIFISIIAATLVMLYYLYRNENFIVKFLGIAMVSVIALIILYFTNDYVAAFLNRFASDDISSGRDVIYGSLLEDLWKGNIVLGQGTGATYVLAEKGAHNIFLQILYDHGLFFSIPYYAFLIKNYRLAFERKCHISIYIQTVFLVYGIFGNPLYSNMFMIIYIVYVLYTIHMQKVPVNDE